jgi:hypothetical protein
MADLRKWFVVLALVVFAASASAQTQFTCAVTPGSTPVVRDGGIAELVGEAVLQCSGGTTGTTTTTNVQVFLSTNVTSDFVHSIPGLIVRDAAGAIIQVVPGEVAPSSPNNSVLFRNVQLPQGGTAVAPSATVRITNIRVAVPPAVPNSFIPTQVVEFVSTSPFGAVPVNNPPAGTPVAYVQPAFKFDVTDCTGHAAIATTFQQCVSQPQTAGAIQFAVRFTELFPTAFKPVGSESGVTVTGPASSAGGTATTSDTASQGTRFIVRFSNVPAGVSIFVTDREISGASTTGVTALNVPDAKSDGSGGTPGAGGSKAETATCNGDNVVTNTGETAGLLVPAEGTGSNLFAVWEITASDLVNFDTVAFGVSVQFEANTSAGLPALTTTPGAVTGTLAPVTAETYLTATQSTTLPRPRFNAAPQSGTTPFAIVACVTNLLFPYVTSTGGYDTGIALVNTSLDNSTGSEGTPPDQPFATPTQDGPCTVYFFGNMDIAPAVTPTVEHGKLVKFTMTQAPEGATGWPNTAGFEGYVIARCNFQFGHGLAFIVDTHLPGFGSEAYLALVIPDRASATARVPDPFTTCANGGAGCGEQLIH